MAAKSTCVNVNVFPKVILIDDREKLPYSFENIPADKKHGGGVYAVRRESAHLKTGDYVIQGSDLIAIERKSLQDLWGTITRQGKRFDRELQRLADEFKYSAVVVECNLFDLAHAQPFSRADPKTVFRFVTARMLEHPVKWVFAGNREQAERMAFRLMERAYYESIKAER